VVIDQFYLRDDFSLFFSHEKLQNRSFIEGVVFLSQSREVAILFQGRFY
jgi:hypothetical protein